jgi:hypothetical protein
LDLPTNSPVPTVIAQRSLGRSDVGILQILDLDGGAIEHHLHPVKAAAGLTRV